MTNGHVDEDVQLNERRRRIAEELIASEMLRRQRLRTEKALLESIDAPPREPD